MAVSQRRLKEKFPINLFLGLVYNIFFVIFFYITYKRLIEVDGFSSADGGAFALCLLN